jgi:hypothetical protein
MYQNEKISRPSCQISLHRSPRSPTGIGGALIRPHKIRGKSNENRGWLVMMLGVLFQGPRWISNRGNLSVSNETQYSRKNGKK